MRKTREKMREKSSSDIPQATAWIYFFSLKTVFVLVSVILVIVTTITCPNVEWVKS